MNKYNYKKETMFFIWNNNVIDFSNKLAEYFKKKHNITTECKGVDGDFIDVKFNINNNYVLIKFKYDESLFYNCYKNDGFYECEKYVGTRSIIHKFTDYLFCNYLIITKKEPLICHTCGSKTGIVFNDFDSDENSICAGGGEHDDPKIIYDYDEDGINQCYSCGEYFCNDCSKDKFDYDSDFICENCQEVKFYDYISENCDSDCTDCQYDYRCNYEERLLSSNWKHCEFDEDDENYEECDTCEIRTTCIQDAEENRSGYASFCDCMVNSGYDSMDDFWESNGI